ncbi:S41 family peptidase [Deinococcus detaillensis]|nr:S41 family peptidase [Deinococcus detaillensis]
MKKRLVWRGLLLGMVLSGLGAAQSQPPALNSPPLNLTNALYLSKALTYIQTHALYSSRVDWPKTQAEAQRLAQTTTTTAQLYPFLREVIRELGDHHSAFQTPTDEGLLLNNLGKPDAGYLAVATLDGLHRVSSVFAGSRAAQAGLRAGDLIVSYQNNGSVSRHLTWRHSGERTTHTATWPLQPNTSPVPAVGRALPNHLGTLELYSNMPWASPTLQIKYAAQAQAQLKSADQTARCGWILDLRRDEGGNTGAMMLALGPLLGDGSVMTYWPQRQAALSQQVIYKEGQVKAVVAGRPRDLGLIFALPHPVTLKVKNPPVAVLQGSFTASAAEGLVVAFHGRPLTRFFGAATYGVPTGNAGIRLPDGASIRLTEGVSVDRQGHQYEGPIAPDVVTAEWSHFGEAGDPTLIAATQWLESQASCRAAR